MHISKDANRNIYLNQGSYTQQIINCYRLNNIKPRKAPTDISKKQVANNHSTAIQTFIQEYQSIVGSANFLSTDLQPDLAYPIYGS